MYCFMTEVEDQDLVLAVVLLSIKGSKTVLKSPPMIRSELEVIGEVGEEVMEK